MMTPVASFAKNVALDAALQKQGTEFYRSLTEQHANLFSDAAVSISQPQLVMMHEVIQAIEEVVHLPGWSQACGIPPRQTDEPKGVFYGYDFHLNEQGVHLIEINTNAGGAFLNAVLLESQAGKYSEGTLTATADLESTIVEMFHHEWRLVGAEATLKVVVIVDEQPQHQYLYPEFLLAKQWFERAGINAFIADPLDVEARIDGLYFGEQKIDLIYNRLTDFSLMSYPTLLNAYHHQQVVVTPHPLVYTRYADKRNLEKLTDEFFLKALGVGEKTIRVLQHGIPQTRIVKSEDAESWWASRKLWFFKPNTGYGAKGAYRGEKVTKRVFEEILAGDYVAQKLAPPGECWVQVNEESVSLKYDVRCYVYDGQIQLIAARLYQGQTTNFRTVGGGFGVVRVSD